MNNTNTTNTTNTTKDELITILDQVYLMPEDNLMDKILSYCEQNDFCIQEIGDVLSESEQFKTKLWIDCVDNNTIRDELLKEKQNSTDKLDVW